MNRSIPLTSSPSDTVIIQQSPTFQAALTRVAKTAKSVRTRVLFQAMVDGTKVILPPAENKPEPRRGPPPRPPFTRLTAIK